MSGRLNLEYLYYFSDQAICILEAKINDLEIGAPPDKVFHWLRYDRVTHRLEKLCFQSMGSDAGREFRLFEQGELRFDDSQADLRLETTGCVQEFRLVVNEPESVPVEIKAKVQGFLESLPGPNSN